MKKAVRFVKSNWILFLFFVLYTAYAAHNLSDSWWRLNHLNNYENGTGAVIVAAAAVLGAVLQVCINNKIFTQNRFQRRRRESVCQFDNFFGHFNCKKTAWTDALCTAGVGIFWLITVWVYDIFAVIPEMGLELGCSMFKDFGGFVFRDRIQFGIRTIPYVYGFFHLISAFLVTKAVICFLTEPVLRKKYERKNKLVRIVKSNYVLFLGFGVLAAYCLSDFLWGSRGFGAFEDRTGIAVIAVAAILLAVLQACINNKILTQNRFQRRRGKIACEWKNDLGSIVWTKTARVDGICTAAVGICWMFCVWVYDILAMVSYIAFGLLCGTLIATAKTAFQDGIRLTLWMVPYACGFFHMISVFFVTKAALRFLVEPVPRKAISTDALEA